MPEEWGPWIEHDGKGVPAGVVGSFVRAVTDYLFAGLVEEEGFISADYPLSDNALAWDHSQFCRVVNGMRIPRVVCYCVRKPRALLELIELIDLVENLPAPHREREDA